VLPCFLSGIEITSQYLAEIQKETQLFVLSKFC